MAVFAPVIREIMGWKVAGLAVSTLILAWLLWKLLFLDAFMSPLRKLPGPPRSLFLGNLLQIHRKGLLNATKEWSKKYGGMFVMWLRPSKYL